KAGLEVQELATYGLVGTEIGHP
ncbi:MAG: hypothetical protein RLZZ519_826, partial [Bacteroidota bacterium]